MSGRLYRALSVMHQRVQDEIDTASKAPSQDALRIGHLKRLKLSIKDRMRSILQDDPHARPDGRTTNPDRRRASFGGDA